MSRMSESAAIIKLFFRSIVAQNYRCGYTSNGGSKLSAVSGAKTRLGFRAQLSPSIEFIRWDWHQRDKSQGSGDSVPRETSSPLLSNRSVCSAHSQIPLFRRTHVFALNFCMSLFR